MSNEILRGDFEGRLGGKLRGMQGEGQTGMAAAVTLHLFSG